MLLIQDQLQVPATLVETTWRAGAGVQLPGWEAGSSTLAVRPEDDDGSFVKRILLSCGPQDPPAPALTHSHSPLCSSHTGPLALNPHSHTWTHCIHTQML